MLRYHRTGCQWQISIDNCARFTYLSICLLTKNKVSSIYEPSYSKRTIGNLYGASGPITKGTREPAINYTSTRKPFRVSVETSMRRTANPWPGGSRDRFTGELIIDQDLDALTVFAIARARMRAMEFRNEPHDIEP